MINNLRDIPQQLTLTGKTNQTITNGDEITVCFEGDIIIEAQNLGGGNNLPEAKEINLNDLIINHLKK